MTITAQPINAAVQHLVLNDDRREPLTPTRTTDPRASTLAKINPPLKPINRAMITTANAAAGEKARANRANARNDIQTAYRLSAVRR